MRGCFIPLHKPARCYPPPGARGNGCLHERGQAPCPALGCSRRDLSPQRTWCVIFAAELSVIPKRSTFTHRTGITEAPPEAARPQTGRLVVHPRQGCPGSSGHVCAYLLLPSATARYDSPPGMVQVPFWDPSM